MSKKLLVIVAILVFVWFNVATYWWVNSFASVSSAITTTWAGLIGNWMSIIILVDSALFLVLAFVWLVVDAGKRGWTGFKRWGWIPAILAFGSPALMIYLVVRPEIQA